MGIVSELGRLGPGSIITETALAKLLGRHPISIKRAVGRGELPQPIRLMGKPVWTAEAILKHLEKRLADAAKEVEGREEKMKRLMP